MVGISIGQQLEEFFFDPSGVLVSSQFTIDFGQRQSMERKLQISSFTCRGPAPEFVSCQLSVVRYQLFHLLLPVPGFQCPYTAVTDAPLPIDQKGGGKNSHLVV